LRFTQNSVDNYSIRLMQHACYTNSINRSHRNGC